MYDNENYKEFEKDIFKNINKLNKKIRVKKPEYLKRNKKITLYLTGKEKEQIEALTQSAEAEQDLIKKLLNEKYNINLYIAS